MATKRQLIDAILDLDSNQDKVKLLKMRKADLETRLNAMEQATQPQPDEPDTTPKGTMHALRIARKHYVNLQRSDGGNSLGCGDPVQQALLAYGPADLVDLATMADKLIGPCPKTKRKPEQGHWDRYSSLNNGQIRMNIGNRLRAALKKGKIKVNAKGTLVAA